MSGTLSKQERHISNTSLGEFFGLFSDPPPPPNGNQIRRQNPEHFSVQSREVMKMLYAIFMFNFQVIGGFFGAKFKFGIMNTFGDFIVSLWAVLIHLGLSPHFIFTISKNRDVIRNRRTSTRFSDSTITSLFL
jgi:hypothetical protein